jgi:Family of unknown function (DUF6893)
VQPADPARASDPDRTASRRYVMRVLRYTTGTAIAATSMALALLVITSLPDVRRYLKIRKM